MISVPCAVIVRDGKILATKRLSDKEQGGLWESPGGKTEGMESELWALYREVWEELGVKIDIGQMICKIELGPPELRAQCLLSFWHCTILDDQPEPFPHAASELGWFTPEEFAKLDWALANRKCMDQILAGVAKVIEDGLTQST